MPFEKFKGEIEADVSGILDSSFSVDIRETQHAPNPEDKDLTYPNIDTGRQVCKLLESCVLYVDIRKSTELNLSHRPKTMAKLYSAFVRAMVKCGRHFGGHVRGIIGDRVMVVFDAANCYEAAVNTAVLMNTVADQVLNRKFQHNEIVCGIGIDYGRMLIAKTGVIRRGAETGSYRGLVWLGRPANVASKLTDLAAKEAAYETVPTIREGHHYPFINEFLWLTKTESEFIDSLRPRELREAVPSNCVIHSNPNFFSYIRSSELRKVANKTQRILLTQRVHDGFVNACPHASMNKKGLIRKDEQSSRAGYGDIYGSDAYFSNF